MKARFALLLLIVCTIPGCYRYAHLYPVQGPLASLTPPPVYTVKMTGVFNSGNVTATLADGEDFSGPWKAISVKERATAGSPASFSLASAWDTVYGQGFYTAHVLGTHLFAQASLVGKQGAVLQVEMYRQVLTADPGAPLDIKGVAKDSTGNVYKLAF